MADKARSAFFKALLRVLSFPAVSTFSENLFARGGLGPIGVFRVGPLQIGPARSIPMIPIRRFLV